MTNEQFLQQFGHFIDAPNGIQKLREMVLQLAVKGKLVAQDSNDEAASIPIKKIQLAKEQQIADGKFKKPKVLPSITDDDDLCELPHGWSHARLGELIRVINGRAYKRHEMLESGTPLLRVGNLFTSNEWYYSDLELEDDKYCDEGDLIYAWSASFGPFIWSGPKVIYHYHIWKLDFYDDSLLFKNYLYTFLQEKTQEIKASGHGISMAHMTKDKMEKLIVPVPPLAEQHRIVAKVDELMALCDQLEAECNARETTHQRLIRAVHHPLTEAADAKATKTAWHRIRDNFADLYTTIESVQALRQTILQLAVQGKLVEHNPNEKPASALLDEIESERQIKIKKKLIKRNKFIREIEYDDVPFELATGWKWSRFGSLVEFKSELVQPDEFQDHEQIAPDSIEKGTGKLILRRTVEESGIKGPNNRFYEGQILYSKIRPSLSKAIIAPCDGLCSADMYPLEALIDKEFLLRSILSEVFLEQVRVLENRIKMPKLNVDSLSNILVPVPPLPEQHRIVTKVDELMSLCDQLEANIRDKNDTATRYAEAIVQQIAAP